MEMESKSKSGSGSKIQLKRARWSVKTATMLESIPRMVKQAQQTRKQKKIWTPRPKTEGVPEITHNKIVTGLYTDTGSVNSGLDIGIDGKDNDNERYQRLGFSHH